MMSSESSLSPSCTMPRIFTFSPAFAPICLTSIVSPTLNPLCLARSVPISAFLSSKSSVMPCPSLTSKNGLTRVRSLNLTPIAIAVVGPMFTCVKRYPLCPISLSLGILAIFSLNLASPIASLTGSAGAKTTFAP